MTCVETKDNKKKVEISNNKRVINNHSEIKKNKVHKESQIINIYVKV